MKTRLIGGVVALLLAVVGTVVVGTYVSGAESRAYAGTKTREVLVVAKPVPEGTSAADLGATVRLEALPAKVVTAESVTSVRQLSGTVASTDLVPGEQVLSSRFVSPEKLAASGGATVPKGMQQLTVSLDPERVVGGNVKPGDTVGVYISVEKPPATTPSTTHAFHAVLVTDVKGGTTSSQDASSSGSTGQASDAPPAAALLVTLAVKAADAEDIIWGQEFGRLWLTLEPTDATDAGTKVTTVKEVLR